MASRTPAKPPKKDKKKDVKHLCQLGWFDGVLSRNATYKGDARGQLRTMGIYDNVVTIRNGIMKQKSVTKSTPPAEIEAKVPKYKYDYVNVDMKQRPLNFDANYAGRPFYHEAHHILVCELFQEEMWDMDHLNIVLQSDYDINNERNIIYLPDSSAKDSITCYYHDLPNHRLGHGRYNTKVLKYVQEVYEKADEALDEEECERKDQLLEEIWKLLTGIEDEFWEYLVKRGPRPIG